MYSVHNAAMRWTIDVACKTHLYSLPKVKNPVEEKFRRVKLSNAKISKALSCPGAEELLLAAGFVKQGDALEAL